MALYYAQQFATTKLSVTGGIDTSQTTGIVLQSVTGIDITVPGVLCLSWSDPLDVNAYEWISYTSIDGSNELQGVTRGAEGSTGRAHANLVDVAWVLTESHINKLVDMFETAGEGFKEISGPSSPSSGRHKLYFKSDGLLYNKNSSGTETALSVMGADGWSAGTGTWTYSSADDPTFVIATSADQTGLIGVGDRIKLTQTTAKYFIVTAIDASTITVYGGTDYDLANAAITSPYYSHMKAPLGFPLTPAKWSVLATDSTDRTQATPTSGTFYNLGSFSSSIPIGVWHVRYCVHVRATEGTAAACTMQTALSTANNSNSDASLSTYVVMNVSTVGDHVASRTKTLTLASKTTYYLNTNTGAVGIDSIANLNSTAFPAVIEAICAYL